VNFGTKTALTKILNIQLFDIAAFTAEKHAPCLSATITENQPLIK
jgi:hypothetical protein